jgi:hypothetical protein
MQLRLAKQDSTGPSNTEKQLPYRAVLPNPVADPIQVVVTTGPASGAHEDSPALYVECRRAVHDLLKVAVCVHADGATARHVTPQALRRTWNKYKYVQLPAGDDARVEVPAGELQPTFELPQLLPQLPSLPWGLRLPQIWGPGEYRLRRGGTM